MIHINSPAVNTNERSRPGSPDRKTDIDLHAPILSHIAIDIKDRSVIEMISRFGKPSAEYFLIHHKQQLRKSIKVIDRVFSTRKRVGQKPRILFQCGMIRPDRLAQLIHTSVFIGYGRIVYRTVDIKRIFGCEILIFFDELTPFIRQIMIVAFLPLVYDKKVSSTLSAPLTPHS